MMLHGAEVKKLISDNPVDEIWYDLTDSTVRESRSTFNLEHSQSVHFSLIFFKVPVEILEICLVR